MILSKYSLFETFHIKVVIRIFVTDNIRLDVHAAYNLHHCYNAYCNTLVLHKPYFIQRRFITSHFKNI